MFNEEFFMWGDDMYHCGEVTYGNFCCNFGTEEDFSDHECKVCTDTGHTAKSFEGLETC